MTKNFFDQCEQEALHLSGHIQAHGSLIVTDANGTVSHLANNLFDFLQIGTEIKLDNPLPAQLSNWVAELGKAVGSRQYLNAISEGTKGLLDVTLTRNTHLGINIELTLNGSAPLAPRQNFPGIERPSSQAALEALQQAIVDRIFDITGYQRVMYYRFREDGDGEVLAERRQADIYGSYLGLRFPASDVPQIARTLYVQNPWRQIADTSSPAVPLHSNHQETADLTYVDLRSVSPMHTLYLKNMGVGASLSFPLVVGNELWGLIACHRSTPEHLPQCRLAEIAQDVRTHMMSVAAFSSYQRIQLTEGLARKFNDLRDLFFRKGDLLQAWPELASWLAAETRSDGANICLGTQRESWGLCFEDNPLEAFDHWFTETQDDSMWLGDNLNRQIPGLGLSQIAGVLAVKVRLSHNRLLRVYLTRQEHIHEVAWGGNPEKPIEHNNGAISITPRRSFEKWMERRLGRCRPWENETRLIGFKLREFLTEVGRNA
jgi:light-regulated signal transduction histidine kinase (bacteriophytochrome)